MSAVAIVSHRDCGGDNDTVHADLTGRHADIIANCETRLAT